MGLFERLNGGQPASVDIEKPKQSPAATTDTRQFVKIAEAIEQQRLVMRQQRLDQDSVLHWAQTCIDNNMISLPLDVSRDLEQRILKRELYASYELICKRRQVHPDSKDRFGKGCAKMFGPRRRVTRIDPGWKSRRDRPWGFNVPNARTWQKTLDALVGIPKTVETDQLN
jgi:hypothetical protein